MTSSVQTKIYIFILKTKQKQKQTNTHTHTHTHTQETNEQTNNNKYLGRYNLCSYLGNVPDIMSQDNNK